ncbi:MAG: HAMP domain-containing histidine kinase [Alphaproteobacteria bacterium]|nr:HAMP domain-containing histidine kinase [Alphaproteobacteria bacterium]
MFLLGKFLHFLDKRTTEFGAQYKSFGIFGIINYPLCYFILYYAGSQTNEDLTIRLIATALCVPLIFVSSWPDKAKKYLNLYWFITILYCLPFLGTYMLLKNNISNEWLMNEVLGLFLLIFLADWLIFSLLLSLGIAFGYLIFMATQQALVIPTNETFSFTFALYTYVYAIGLGLIFARNKEIIYQERQKTAEMIERIKSMEMLAGAMAHELRTPLGSISLIAQVLKMHIPTLIKGYKWAKEKNPEIEGIDEDYIEKAPTEIETTTRGAFSIIDILLMNVKGVTNEASKEPCDIKVCIQNALAAYPLTSTEKQIIYIDTAENFTFQGNELFMRHVLFNLLKNALYYVKSANKGGVYMRTERSADANILYFKDTGKGMPASMVPHVFERFYSKTQHGTGIGLAFCKSVMENFGGNISCESIEGEHTTFILRFPK